jgi:uroporphyrinogen-III synthase
VSSSHLSPPLTPPTRVWVTRAPQDAAPWIQGLNDLGLDAQSLPLMAIGPVADMHPVQMAWQDIAQYHAVMFVSANAVRYFFQAATQPALSWGQTRAWVTGLGSRAALLAVGVPESRIDAPASDAPQWDSEALWAVIAPQVQAGQRVLMVRGADAQGRVAGRDWLSTQLQAAGVLVDPVAAYQRQTPLFSTEQRASAVQAAADGSVWLFSNSEAIAHLQAALPDQDWSQALAVATHARIAQHARLAGWGSVAIAQPSLFAVATSIKSIHEFRTPRSEAPPRP